MSDSYLPQYIKYISPPFSFSRTPGFTLNPNHSPTGNQFNESLSLRFSCKHFWSNILRWFCLVSSSVDSWGGFPSEPFTVPVISSCRLDSYFAAWFPPQPHLNINTFSVWIHRSVYSLWIASTFSPFSFNFSWFFAILYGFKVVTILLGTDIFILIVSRYSFNLIIFMW